MEFTGAAEKFTADLSLVEDPQAKAAIEALGYQTISGIAADGRHAGSHGRPHGLSASTTSPSTMPAPSA